MNEQNYTKIISYLRSFFTQRTDKFDVEYAKNYQEEDVINFIKCRFIIKRNEPKYSEEFLSTLLKDIEDALHNKKEIKINLKHMCSSFLPGNSMKAFMKNMLSRTSTNEELTTVFSLFFHNFDFSEVLSDMKDLSREQIITLIKIPKKVPKDSGSLYNNQVNSIIWTLFTFSFTKEEIKDFLPVFLDNYEHVFISNNGSSSMMGEQHAQKTLFEFIRTNLDEKDRVDYIHYLPDYAAKIKPLEEDLTRTIFLNENKASAFIKIDMENITKKYPSLILDKDVKEMLEKIKDALKIVSNPFNLSTCELFYDFSKNDYHGDVCTIHLIAKDETPVDIKKLKDVVNELIVLYGNEKTLKNSPDIDYLEKAYRFFLLRDNLPENEQNKIKKIKM